MGQTLSEPVVDKVGEKRLNQVRCLETPLFPILPTLQAIPDAIPNITSHLAFAVEISIILPFCISPFFASSWNGPSCVIVIILLVLFPSLERFQICAPFLRGLHSSKTKSFPLYDTTRFFFPFIFTYKKPNTWISLRALLTLFDSSRLPQKVKMSAVYMASLPCRAGASAWKMPTLPF